MTADPSQLRFFVDETSLGLGKALAIARRDLGPDERASPRGRERMRGSRARTASTRESGLAAAMELLREKKAQGLVVYRLESGVIQETWPCGSSVA